MTPGQRGLWRWYDGIPTPYVVIITAGVACPSPGYVAPTPDQVLAADGAIVGDIFYLTYYGDAYSLDPASGRDGKAIFVGGRTYSITDEEAASLIAAGYTVSGP